MCFCGVWLRVVIASYCDFFFNDTATTEIDTDCHTLSLHDARPICKLFPPITVHLIASGESSGRLDEMLDRSAENQEREVEMLVQTTVSIFERSEEHTSELQSLMRISYAVFCLKKNNECEH